MRAEDAAMPKSIRTLAMGAWVALFLGCAGPSARPPTTASPVVVDVTADRKGISLERLADKRWTPLCALPCSTSVLAGEPLRLDGKNVVRSEPFVVRRPSVVRARVGYYDMRVLGITLMSIGLAASGFGVLTAGTPPFGGTPALVVIGAGLGLTAGGIAAFATNRTSIDVHERTVARIAFVF